jgi:hypothetical protein
MKILEITTCLPCRNRCSYCPQELLMKNYRGIDTLTLEKFKEMLKNVPKDVIINFAGFVEPFQNNECVDMIVYADKMGYKIKVFTTLVGFTKKDADKIKHIKFDRFYIHELNTETEKIEYPFITDRMNEAEYKPFLTSRAGNLWKVPYKEQVTGCLAQGNCSDAVALPNGDLYCCMDYGLTKKLGNIFEMNFNDIPKLTEFKLCHYCEYAKTN